MDFVISRLMSRLSEWHDEHNRVADKALLENLTRLPWVIAFLLPLLGVGLMLAWGPEASSDAAVASHIRLIGWLDLGMAVWLGGLLVWLLANKRHRGITPFTRVLPLLLAVNFVGFGVVLSISSQAVLPSATMYVLTCVFAGTLLLIRPSQMVLMFGVSYVVFHVGLGLTDAPWPVLVVMRFHGFIAAVLGICLSLVLWRRHTVTELLRRQVQAQSHALAVQNTELERQKKLLEQLAQHDALTGLLNRREFEVQADMALQRARRDGTGISAVMFDLDFFKRINDQHGHPVGDLAIKAMAGVLRGSVRDTDLVARVGGEEFMLLLPDTSVSAAAEVAEKIRLRVGQTLVPLALGKVVPMTVSAGVAELAPGQITTFEHLYADADRALYEAKHRGRDQVVAHAHGTPGALTLAPAASFETAERPSHD